MAGIYLLPDNQTAPAWLDGNVTVTVAGTVRAPNGAAIRRAVSVFLNNNKTAPVAQTVSTEPHGTFSVTIGGLPTTEFAVVASGAPGENDVIYAHCKE